MLVPKLWSWSKAAPCMRMVRNCAFRPSLQPLITVQSSKWDIQESHSLLSNAANDSGITTGLFCDTEVDVPEPEGVALILSLTIIWMKKWEISTTGLHDKPLAKPANIPQTQLRQQVSQQLTNKQRLLPTPRIAKLADPCGYFSKRFPRRLGSSYPTAATSVVEFRPRVD